MPFKFKLAAGLALAVLFFGLGWASRGKEIQTVEVPKEVVKTQTQVQTVEKVVNHTITKVVTVTKKAPDGTQTTTKTVETTAAKAEDVAKTVDRDTQRTESVASSKADSQWSLGLGWQPRVSADPYLPSRVEVGRRLLGPVWGEVGGDWRDKTVTVGVRVEW